MLCEDERRCRRSGVAHKLQGSLIPSQRRVQESIIFVALLYIVVAHKRNCAGVRRLRPAKLKPHPMKTITRESRPISFGHHPALSFFPPENLNRNLSEAKLGELRCVIRSPRTCAADTTLALTVTTPHSCKCDV